MGVFCTMGGYHDTCGDILSTMGVFSTMGDIMSTVGCYLEYHGGYHEYHGWLSWVPWGCSVLWGYSNNKRFSPTVLMISPMCSMIFPWYWVSPMVLKITPDSDIPHGTEHPMVLKISPTVLNIPHSTQYIPTVLNTPMVLHNPHSTAHMLYRVRLATLLVLVSTWFDKFLPRLYNSSP